MVGTEGLEMLVALDDTLEEERSAEGTPSDGVTRGDGAFEVIPELSIELARSSLTTKPGCDSWA